MLPRISALTPLELKAAIVRDPLIVSPETTVVEAITHMSAIRTCKITASESLSQDREQRSGSLRDDLYLEVRSSCVLIANDNQQLVGILTERDIVRLCAQQQSLEQLTMQHVMAQSVLTLHESEFTDLFQAIDLLQQHGIRHLPILDAQNRIVGLVTHESLRQISRPIDLLRLRLVREVMTRNVICAEPDASMLEVAQKMAEHRVSCVIIIAFRESTQSHKIPVGMVTERDMVQFQALRLNLLTCQAQQVMSQPVFSVKPDESLATVQHLIERHFIRRLAVTGKDNELLGIVTQTSLLQALQPLGLHKLAEVLEARVLSLEAEKVALLENRTIELEQQVKVRTASLQLKVEQEKLLSGLATQIQASLSLPILLDTIVQEVRQLLNCERVNIWQFDEDSHSMVVAESTSSPISLVGEHTVDTCFKEHYADVYRQGHIRVIPDICSTPMSDCHREMLVRFRTRAKIVVPLLCGQQLWGLLIAAEGQFPRDWKAEEVELLKRLAVKLAIAIRQATTLLRLEEELSERRQADARLRESEQRFSSLAAVAPVGIFRIDLNGNCTYVNERCCQITGLTTDSLLGKDWRQCFHPDDQNLLTTKWSRLIQEGQPFQIEYRCLRPDNTVAWVYNQSTAEYDAKGEIIGYVGTITDISDRKHAEAQLEIRNELLATIVEDKPLIDILNTVIESIEHRISGAFCSVMLNLNGLLWYGAPTRLPSSYIQATEGIAIAEGIGSCGTAAFRNETVITVDIRNDPLWENYRDIAQQSGLAACWSLPIKTSDGRGLGTLAVYYLTPKSPNPSELNLIEQVAKIVGIAVERKQSEEALRSSEAQYRRIVETANEGIWIVDNQNQTSFVNPKMSQMLGLSTKEMQGRCISDFVDEADRSMINKLECCSETVSAQQDFRFKHQNGSEIWALIAKTPIFEELGQCSGALYMITDISDRKQTERELENLIEGTAATTGENFFSALLGHLASALGVSFAIVSETIEQRIQTLAFWANGKLQPNFSFQPTNTPCKITIKTGKFYCEDRLLEQFPEAYFLRELGATTYLGVALQDTSGQVIGNLCILNHQPIHNPKRAEKLLRVFAARASTELERERTTKALEALNKDLETRVLERTAALQASEERWHLALRGANDGIWDWKLSQKTIFFSDRWKEMRGFSSNEISNTPEEYLNRIHPEDFDRVNAAIKAHFAGQSKFFEVEYRTQHKNGSYMWVLDRAQALRDESGKVLRMIGSETDITQRKEAEADLRESERRYSTLAAAAPVAICQFNTSLNCTYVNEIWSQMSGRPRTSALGQGWLEALHPDDREHFITQSIKSSSDPNSHPQLLNHGEGRHIRPDGNINWFYLQVASETDVEGNVKGYIATLTDITALKLAEANLQKSEQLYRTLMDEASDTILLADNCGNLVEGNQKAEHLLGYSRDELTSLHISQIHPPEFLEAAKKHFDSILLNKTGPILESAILRKDGTQAWVEISASQFEINGKLFAQGIFRDVSDRKKAEMALTQSQQFLQTVLDTFPLSVFWKDSKSRYLGCNRNFLDDAGFESVSQIMNKTDYEMPWGLTEADAYRLDDQQVMNNGQAKLGIIETQLQFKGKQRWIETNNTNSQIRT